MDEDIRPQCWEEAPSLDLFGHKVLMHCVLTDGHSGEHCFEPSTPVTPEGLDELV